MKLSEHIAELPAACGVEATVWDGVAKRLLGYLRFICFSKIIRCFLISITCGGIGWPGCVFT